nr:MAG TPA: hypothetical protein [Caudoviricetes sp.]
MTSVVRIHHLPPKRRTYRKRCVLFVYADVFPLISFDKSEILIFPKVAAKCC